MEHKPSLEGLATSGIQGSNPFQCQLAGKEGQFLCTQSWTYQLAK